MEHWKRNDYAKYETFIRDTERLLGIPRNLLALVLYQASKYDPAIITGAGQHPLSSIGIAKLTAQDADYLWDEQPAPYDARRDPHTNRRNPHLSIIGAARLLRSKHLQFGSWRTALLAYHTSDNIAASTLRKGERMPIDAAEYVRQITAQVHI